jgi:hypothetical protein
MANAPAVHGRCRHEDLGWGGLFSPERFLDFGARDVGAIVREQIASHHRRETPMQSKLVEQAV